MCSLLHERAFTCSTVDHYLLNEGEEIRQVCDSGVSHVGVCLRYMLLSLL